MVLDGEDEPAFQAMAERLLADLAPAGELAAFLAGDLAAAMWRTGRARRLERRAFAGDVPDPDKLNLALRYGGSASRELYRALRALDRLRHRPRPDHAAPHPVPDGEAPERGSPRSRDRWRGRASVRRPSRRVAALAWGAGGPPPPPPGCLLVRPVPSHWSRSWYRHQADAFPGAEPVAVAADGTIHALEAGAWVVQPPHLPPGARPPAAPAPAAEQAAITAIRQSRRPSPPRPCRLRTALPRNRGWPD